MANSPVIGVFLEQQLNMRARLRKAIECAYKTKSGFVDLELPDECAFKMEQIVISNNGEVL